MHLEKTLQIENIEIFKIMLYIMRYITDSILMKNVTKQNQT